MGYHRVSNKTNELFKLRNNDTTKGVSTGFAPLDAVWSLKKGYPLYIGGEPSSGKSEITLELALNASVLFNWKHFVYLGEAGDVEDAIADLCHKYICKPFKKKDGYEMTESERIQAEMFIDEHFVFVDDEEDLTVEGFYKLATKAEKDLGIKFDTTIFDPFYDFVDESNTHGGMFQFVNNSLKITRKTSKENDRIDILVNHVADIPPTIDKETGNAYKRPALPDEWYGGKNWRRRAFSMILTYRPPAWLKDEHGQPFGENVSLIIIQKAKPKGVGIIGAKCVLKWDWKYNRYFWEENGVRKFAFMTNAQKELPQPKMQPNVDFTQPIKQYNDDLPF